jgi:predicted ATPase
MSNPVIGEKPNLYVITGGPSAGKTTLLRELEQRGYAVDDEVARQIIREQMESGGNAVPWGDTTQYTELMLARSIEAFRRLKPKAPTFCDRGIPDVLCYARIIQLADQERIAAACERFRYNRKVFMLPPWPEIYITDTERKQTFEEAVEVYHQMIGAYRDCRYQVIEVPRAAVRLRADFVLKIMTS